MFQGLTPLAIDGRPFGAKGLRDSWIERMVE